MNLYKHQEEILNKNPKKHLLSWGCGSGKTITSIKLVGYKDTLVICPKSLKEQWYNEMNKHAECSYLILTKEEFKSKYKGLFKYKCIIVDEAHFFFGMLGFRKKSLMLKALLEYIKDVNPERLYLLTATPYLSTPYNLYAACEILGTPPNFKKFKEHFFSMVNMGRRFPVPVVKKGIEGDIAKLVQRIGSTVSLEDCFDVPEQTFKVEYFDLTAEQKKAIANLEDEGIARWTKTHQICGGTLKSDGYSENKVFKSEKMDRLMELVDQHKKLIIVCRYNHEIKSIKDRIKKESFVINGLVKDRHEIIKLAESKKDCIMLIQASCSEGYELPSFPIMVFYSLDFSLKNHSQMIGRILRANKLKKNVYISLVVRNSIDNDVYKCIQNKEDFNLAIYEKR